VLVRAAPDGARVAAWGPGADWLADRADRLAGAHDGTATAPFDHPALDALAPRHRARRFVATGAVVEALVPQILAQRVLSSEAARSWRAVVRLLGEPAPGPFGLTLPPGPDRLVDQPSWWWHRLGVERRRAATVAAVARHAHRLAACAEMPLDAARARLGAVPGVGPWTVAGTARVALGDVDAVSVGDYWIRHHVVRFFTGRERGTDDEMLELLAPWAGRRGRVEAMVLRSGVRARRFAPGRPTPRIAAM
jgi:3-methyladenine DNA glycosylase/8-oxoguanine DNA glycosylase